jgi:hypothetical protein
MAKAVITIEDINLDDGTVSCDVVIEGTKLDDGHVTAAHFFAVFLKDQMGNPVFLKQVWDYAEDIMRSNPGGTIVNPDQKIDAPANDTAAEEAA